MNSRNNSFSNSSTSFSSANAPVSGTTTSSLNFNLSPLVKLERLIQRLNLILSKEDTRNDIENQLKLLLKYQDEILKLKKDLGKREKTEFEEEDRIKWIESKEDILNKFIKVLEDKKRRDQIEEEIEDLQVSEESNEPISSVVDDRPSNVLNLNDILPPKPENISLFPAPKPLPNESDSLVFSEEIQSQHHNLTNDLIATVQLIKRNNLHIQNIVKSDEKVINEASGLLGTNSDFMERESKNLNSYSKKASVSFWKMILILLFVCLTFIFIYVFIRLT